MSAKDSLEIIDICKKQGIPYTGVTITPNQFNMRDYRILCEDCDRVKQYIQSNSFTVYYSGNNLSINLHFDISRIKA